MSVKSRLGYLAKQIFVINHEIQHAVQWNMMEQESKDINTISSENLVMSKQNVARYLSTQRGSKYYKNLNPEKLYKDNHDQFYYEIEADMFGFDRTLKLLKNISHKSYELVTGSNYKYLDKLEERKQQIENYSFVMWKHDTNPNNMEVSANHKASLIIDTVFPNLKNSDRKMFFNLYPALNINYHEDGSKKTLDEIESEKAERLRQVLTSTPDKNVNVSALRVSKLYDSAIESDPLLSFEKCMRHISRMSWEEDRYFTNGGMEVKYSPKEIRKELKASIAKASTIVSYMEEVNSLEIEKIFNKYRKEVEQSRKLDPTSLRFINDKMHGIYDIQYKFRKNKELLESIKKNEELVRKKNLQAKMDKENALETLKNVFPNFNPKPQTYVLNKDEMLNNTIELMMLEEAYRHYLRSISKLNRSDTQKDDYVPGHMLLATIRKLYPFKPTDEEKEEFAEALKNGKIEIVANKYENVQTQKKQVEHSKLKENELEQRVQDEIKHNNSQEIENLSENKKTNYYDMGMSR